MTTTIKAPSDGAAGAAGREMVLQAVLDKLWSSVHEFTELNEHGNPSEASRERWQAYANQVLLGWLEYHSPSAADRARAADRDRARRSPGGERS